MSDTVQTITTQCFKWYKNMYGYMANDIFYMTGNDFTTVKNLWGIKKQVLADHDSTGYNSIINRQRVNAARFCQMDVKAYPSTSQQFIYGAYSLSSDTIPENVSITISRSTSNTWDSYDYTMHTINVTVKNRSSSTVTINSINFIQKFTNATGSAPTDETYDETKDKYFLAGAYFFGDSPIVLQSGQDADKVFTIKFQGSNSVQTISTPCFKWYKGMYGYANNDVFYMQEGTWTTIKNLWGIKREVAADYDSLGYNSTVNRGRVNAARFGQMNVKGYASASQTYTYNTYSLPESLSDVSISLARSTNDTWEDTDYMLHSMTITLKNNGTESVTVNSINFVQKFTDITGSAPTGETYDETKDKYFLAGAYFFGNAPITLAAGETAYKVVTIKYEGLLGE